MTGKRNLNLLQIGYGTILVSFLYKYSFLAELPLLGLWNWSIMLDVLGIGILLLQIYINKYKPLQLAAFLLVGALLGVSAFNAKNTMYLLTFLMVVAAKRVNIRKLIETDLKIRIPMTLGIMLLSLLGAITDRVEQRTGGMLRHSLGFSHSNNLGAMLFIIALYWFFLKHKHFKLKDYAGIAALGVFCQVVTDSRTSTLMIALVFLVELLDTLIRLFNKSDRLRDVLLRIGALLFIFVPGLSVYFGYNYSVTNLVHLTLNQLLNSRLYLAYVALKNNGLTLLGQYIEVIPWNVATVAETTNAIDNAYMYTLINFGIVTFIIVLWAIWRIYRYSLNIKDRTISLCLLLLIVEGFVEAKVFHVGENIFLLYFASTLFSGNAEGRMIRQRRKRMRFIF